MTETSNELVLFIEKSEVAGEQKKTLLDSFSKFFEQTEEWKAKAETLVITSVEQKDDMKLAREARLALKNIRVSTEHKRKEMKEESLRTGQTIDAIAKIITNQIVPIEAHLEQQEKFIEIQENNRKDALRDERLEQLAPYGVDATFYDLRNMPDSNFAELLDNSRVVYEAKQEAARKAEEERIASEKAEAEERERIRIENERMRKEQAEREENERVQKVRLTALLPYNQYGADVDMTTLWTLSEYDFDAILDKKEKEHEAAMQAHRESEEQARKEREAAEAEAKRIQAEQQAKLDTERKERDRIAAELKAMQEAEVKSKEEEAARLEAELSKGDKDKFDDLLAELETIKTKYSFKSKKHKTAYTQVGELIDKIINHASVKLA